MPTPHAIALSMQVRDAVAQATTLLAPGAEVELSTLARNFNVRANDILSACMAVACWSRWSRKCLKPSCVLLPRRTMSMSRPCAVATLIFSSVLHGI